MFCDDKCAQMEIVWKHYGKKNVKKTNDRSIKWKNLFFQTNRTKTY